MEFGKIEELLEEFYDGKTTEEQEEVLKNYFETEGVPEQFNIDKEIFFGYGKAFSINEVPLGLESKLIKLIDDKAEEEKRFIVKNRTTFSRKRVGSIAAGIVLLIGLGYGIMNLTNYGEPKDTYSDPKEAYDAVQAALIEISSNLNSGMAQLVEVRQDVNKISNEIKEEIQQ
jgi:hypothetical protein